eukprot:CAMPEP_0170090978 /NCGR_PEP_ID=MMETSP0019_2-20121128/24695_1 /TAXON_ID=98059 /ORGANISM="Dinobryon sp., Strain UTEXLB2267" /LENGTH=124 /DNA_ID=CAMNT_0010310647 /DNA_START=592 /DNA_END=963 /DNA_ORIENTATION=-
MNPNESYCVEIRYAAGDRVLAAVLEADGDRPVGGQVDGQPAQQSPEVGSADGVAVLLEDGFEERVHEGGGGGSEGNQSRIRCGVAETAVGAQFIGLSDVDLAGIVEGQSESLGEDVGASEVIGR